MISNDGQSTWLGQLRRGAAERCVLALLAQGEGYGFDIARTLSAAGLVASEGTIYPLLARLRREGLVDTLWRESSQGPPRRYYVLTASGQTAVEQFKTEWERFKHAVDQLLNSEKRSDNASPKP